MKKTVIFYMVLLLFCWICAPDQSQAQKMAVPAPKVSDLEKDFMPGLIQSISTLAVNMAYDYSKRPVIGVLVADFQDGSGQECVGGNEIAQWLRQGLSKDKQFYVYGNQHPLSFSLKTMIFADPVFKPASQRLFQENLAKNFSLYPVDLIISGTVAKETENRLKITVTVIPFLNKIRLVETETEKGVSIQQAFISPPIAPAEMTRALTPLYRGRLVIIARLYPEFEQTDPLGKDRNKPMEPRPLSKTLYGISGKPWTMTSLNDLTGWLDNKNKKLSLLKIKDWPAWKEREYQAFFSGFGVDTLWFDDFLEEGSHQIFFSFSPAKDRYKTFAQTFKVKRGKTHYLVFSMEVNPLGEPDMRFKYVVDSKNLELPF